MKSCAAAVWTSIFALTACLFFPAISHAHVLETDDQIGAILHIDPDDEPVLHEPATFFFDFKDTSGRYNPHECDCRISITKDGNTYLSQSLFASSSDPTLRTPSFSFVFHKTGVYTVTIEGKPSTGSTFQPFTLRYDVRIERGADAPAGIAGFFGAHLFHSVLAIGAALFVLGGILYDRLITRRKKI